MNISDRLVGALLAAPPQIGQADASTGGAVNTLDIVKKLRDDAP
ncbi:MAG: hypothetical protein Q4G14_01330 [Paracoccus sp. (in: a-proteobacteria)]|nr:hypothetical protein [Paracoccus sp. (in: a-proteobacteria)]MDO5611867.1 hypothetical protein [Paracoccus sp. (in: a-proteobacteria)]